MAGLPIQSGDRLAFSVKASGNVTWGTGFWQTTPQGQVIGSDTLDQTGQSMSLLNISDGQWRHESGDLSNNAGNALHTMLVAFQPATQAGPVEVWLKDLVITHADGSITPILTANQVSMTPVEEPTSHPALSATPQTVAAGTNLTLDYNPIPVDPAESATYYLADQVGTTQMELSSGGWPIWKGDFAPFGQELDTQLTNNHYKFTGKERDTESGLDYFDARYLSSSMGRFMSPDPQGNSYADFSNTQSWNMYSYVLNNPLRYTDSTGMYCDYSDHNDPDDTNNPNNFDYHSSVSECKKTDGQWIDDAYTHGGFDDYDRPEEAVPGLANTSLLPQPAKNDAAKDLLNNTVPGQMNNLGNSILFSLLPKQIGGNSLSLTKPASNILFGTTYCGPGGSGSAAGVMNGPCAIHDQCYAAVPGGGISAANNFPGGPPMSPSQIAGAQACNQALYNAARNHPDAPGSKAVQWWMVNGGHLPHDKYILHPGTEAIPW